MSVCERAPYEEFQGLKAGDFIFRFEHIESEIVSFYQGSLYTKIKAASKLEDGKC